MSRWDFFRSSFFGFPYSPCNLPDYLVYIGSYTNTTSKGIYVSDFDSSVWRALGASPCRGGGFAGATVGGAERPVPLRGELAGQHRSDPSEHDHCLQRSSRRHRRADVHQSGFERWSRPESGRRRSERQGCRRGELPERLGCGVRHRDGWKNFRAVLHRSARGPTAGAVETAGPARARGRVFERQPLRVCRRHRARPRLQLSNSTPKNERWHLSTRRTSRSRRVRARDGCSSMRRTASSTSIARPTRTSACSAVDNGRLKEIQSISTLPDGYAGTNTTAEILISGNRHISVRVESRPRQHRGVRDRPRRHVVGASNTPTPAASIPRNVSLDPTGRYLLSSNQDTETRRRPAHRPRDGSAVADRHTGATGQPRVAGLR